MTDRILIATDEGTHGGPDTVRVYSLREGGFLVVHKHGNAHVGSSKVEAPMSTETDGYMRWIGPKDLKEAWKEVFAAEQDAREEVAKEDALARERERIGDRVRSMLMAAGVGVDRIRWTDRLAPGAELATSTLTAIRRLDRASGGDYDARIGDDCYRVRLPHPAAGGGGVVKLERA